MKPAALPERPPSPLQEIRHTELDAKGLRLLVKRDDLLAWSKNSALCGNKWRKLKYNLLEAKTTHQTHLLTFGGAYSNHLAAAAEAAKVLGFEATGIVRGEETLPFNPTLAFVKQCGMRLVYVNREAYRYKSEPDFLPSIGIDATGVFVLPEGGTNMAALRGCRELAEEIQAQAEADFIAVACGTGGTLAGIVSGLKESCKALGFSVLKGDFHRKEVAALLLEAGAMPADNWQVETAYHFGGYAKWKPELLDFMQEFRDQYGITLDPIYTGKMMYGVFDLIRNGAFPRGSTIVAVHTGGLQGVAGFEQRFSASGVSV
ncbi:MAG TPA: pyridoxal-phosphate dependent enzyme [Saprospiraceae bacterium]|nr:pyridoxal-phosphate dependent enzyme [Saprospiraceae bacterium]HRJ14070.1 pyridoxal-phosphate dependent enzyme [Saprospiraceae bacterium]HRK81475.1 pyridoxal-phosphate dependent enzyme [Saprospiraceae bacterium]